MVRVGRGNAGHSRGEGKMFGNLMRRKRARVLIGAGRWRTMARNARGANTGIAPQAYVRRRDAGSRAAGAPVRRSAAVRARTGRRVVPRRAPAAWRMVIHAASAGLAPGAADGLREAAGNRLRQAFCRSAPCVGGIRCTSRRAKAIPGASLCAAAARRCDGVLLSGTSGF